MRIRNTGFTIVQLREIPDCIELLFSLLVLQEQDWSAGHLLEAGKDRGAVEPLGGHVLPLYGRTHSLHCRLISIYSHLLSTEPYNPVGHPL
jgi:hypothetical protein